MGRCRRFKCIASLDDGWHLLRMQAERLPSRRRGSSIPLLLHIYKCMMDPALQSATGGDTASVIVGIVPMLLFSRGLSAFALISQRCSPPARFGETLG
jgi:hypothetical protein